MEKKNTTHQNYPIILMFIGILVYIAVDMGLFSKNYLQKINPTSKPSIKDSEENLLKYSHRLREELDQVETEIKTEKKKLVGLQSQVASYEKNISQQKQNLGELQKEIKTLSKLKAALKQTKAQVVRAENKKKRMVASNHIPVEPGFSPEVITHHQDVSEKIAQSTGIKATVEEIIYKTGQYLRLNTFIKFNGSNGIYLTQRGMRQTGIFSEAGLGLGYNNILIAHNGNNRKVIRRLDVLQRHLADLYGDRVTISSIEVDKNLKLNDGLEIWMNKEGVVE